MSETARQPLGGFLKDDYDADALYSGLMERMGVSAGRTVAQLCEALDATMRRLDTVTAELDAMRGSPPPTPPGHPA